jgi:hypothetical protein
MSCQQYDLCICKGETFLRTVRWGVEPYVLKPITSISRGAPAVITVPAHGALDGWSVAVTGAKGMTEINARRYPPLASDWSQATRVDASTIALNTVDSSAFSEHEANTGYLVYSTPVDLSGATGRFEVYDNPEMTGTPLLTLTTAPGILIDNTAKTITVQFETAALAWTEGYYKLAVVIAGITRHVLEGVITSS